MTRSLVVFVASLLLFSGQTFAKTAACTCSPCTCSPCTCGSGKGGSKHHDHGKEKEHGHGGVGVGVNVDLGGVGQRKAEPNPFGTTNQPSASKGEPAARANSDDDCRKRLKQLIEAAQEVARLGQISAAIQVEWRRWDDIVLSCDLKQEKALHEAASLHAAVEGGDHPEEVDNYQQAMDRLAEAERERERAGQKRSDVADTAVAAHRAFLAAIESYEKLRIAYERDCHERAPAPPKIPGVRAQPPQPGGATFEMNRPKGLTADEFKTRTRKTIKGWRELAKGAKDPADARHYNAEADRLEKMLEEMR